MFEINELVNFAQGNMGAASFLNKLSQHDPIESILILMTIKNNDELRGAKLWVLYKDLGNMDLDRVYELCAHTPHNILVEACSRSDRSGLELVAPYCTASTPG